MEETVMKKDRRRASKGFEEQARQNFSVLDDILVKNRARAKLAATIDLSPSAIINYTKDGKISWYAVNKLSELFDLPQQVFTGETALVKDSEEYRKIIMKVNELVGNASYKPSVVTPDETTEAGTELLDTLRQHYSDKKFYDSLSESEIADLEKIASTILEICRMYENLGKIFNDTAS